MKTAPSHLALAALLCLAASLFLTPVADIDFWWHIANGRWIVEAMALPTKDPSGIYPIINSTGQTILQGQWAGQVLLYLTYAQFGEWGVISLRTILLLLTIALVGARIGNDETTLLVRTASLAALVVVLAGYAAERPQLFSLLMFAATMCVLSMSDRRPAWQWALIPLLITWTNLHQAVLLGAAVAAMWLCSAAYGDWKARLIPQARGRVAAAAGCLLAPLATPNGLNAIQYVIWLEQESTKQRISEYASPLAYLGQALDYPHLLVFFGFALVLLAVIAMRFRTAPRNCAIALFLLIAALSTYRYVPFAVIAGMPLVASGFAHAPANQRIRRLISAFAAALIGLAIGIRAMQSWPTLGQGIDQRRFPVDLTRGIGAQPIAGRVFTTIGWGGYMSWAFTGQAIPFIDGRYLMDPQRVDEYTHILWFTERGERLMAHHGFDWVIVPYRNAIAANAPRYRIIDSLSTNPRWKLEAFDNNGVAFRRVW